MLYPCDQKRIDEIGARLYGTESKIIYAQNYKEDVGFLLSVINELFLQNHELESKVDITYKKAYEDLYKNMQKIDEIIHNSGIDSFPVAC